jgi:hypothetical protein
MGKPYSDDLRERVVAAIEAGRKRYQVRFDSSELRKLAFGRADPDFWTGVKDAI